jgi:hypothetical protein
MNQPSCLVVRETWVYLCEGNERPPSSHFSTFQTQIPVGSYVMIITPSASVRSVKVGSGIIFTLVNLQSAAGP